MVSPMAISGYGSCVPVPHFPGIQTVCEVSQLEVGLLAPLAETLALAYHL